MFHPMRFSWLFLIAPCAGLAWVPFFNSWRPELFGFPFFYWYQLLWVPITTLLIYFVYRMSHHDR